MSITREQVEVAHDWHSVKIDIEAWGGAGLLRTMSCASYETLMRLYTELNEIKDAGDTFATFQAMKRVKVWMLSLTIADKDGVLLFNDDAGRGILEHADNSIIDDLYDQAVDLCQMSEVQVVEEKKELEPVISNGSSGLSA